MKSNGYFTVFGEEDVLWFEIAIDNTAIVEVF